MQNILLLDGGGDLRSFSTDYCQHRHFSLFEYQLLAIFQRHQTKDTILEREEQREKKWK